MLRTFSARRCLAHRPPSDYPECPERLALVLAELHRAGWPIEEVVPHPRSREAVLAVHDAGYVARFERSVERGDGIFDTPDNPIMAATADAAWAAVDVALHAADWVASGPGRRAFAAVRPPGHHAERSMAMGFCFFGNVAIAASYLTSQHGLSRVGIFDFDVHHGNGTQHLLEERGDILFISSHQFPFYPGTGAAEEQGLGAGLGATLNLPLPRGTGDEGYLQALQESVLPTLRAFRPEALLLSAGFDAWQADPLGGMKVTEAGFAEWGRRLAEVAAEVCAGRVLVVLEGGYDLEALPRLVRSFLAPLAEGALAD